MPRHNRRKYKSDERGERCERGERGERGESVYMSVVEHMKKMRAKITGGGFVPIFSRTWHLERTHKTPCACQRNRRRRRVKGNAEKGQWFR